MQEIIDTYGVMEHVFDACQSVITVYRVAGVDIRFFNVHDRIDTETGYTAIQPPVDHAEDKQPQPLRASDGGRGDGN